MTTPDEGAIPVSIHEAETEPYHIAVIPSSGGATTIDAEWTEIEDDDIINETTIDTEQPSLSHNERNGRY